MRLRRDFVQTLSVVAGLGIGLAMTGPAALAHPAKRIAVTAAPRNLPDSFLPNSAGGLQGLLTQVRTNPTVRRRYAKFFHVPESQIGAYMQANLTEKRLHQTGRYTVFLVRPNGLVYPTMMTLPRDSAVFALKGGNPVMTAREGNPMMQYRTAQEIHYVTVKQPGPTVIVAGSEQVIVPNQVSETVVSTTEQTPIYQPAPMDVETPAEAAPPPAAPTANK